jgi:hypothetical protein
MGTLAEFACINATTLEMVITDENLMPALLELLIDSNADVEAAVLNGVAQILSRTDNAFVSTPVSCSGDMHVFTAVSGTIRPELHKLMVHDV